MRTRFKLAAPISLASLASFAVVAGAACPPTVPSPVVLPEQPSLFLRATPDGDASSIIGTFVDDDIPDAQIDETRLRVTRCSKFINKKVIPAQGRFKQVVAASANAAAKLGVKGIADIDFGGSRGSAMLVYYDVLEKMQADVDVDNLSRCCADAPGECAKRYISSAVMGQGGYYAATESATNAGADVEIPENVPIDISAVYHDSLKWERRAQFKRQYFAFSFQHLGGSNGASSSSSSGAVGASDCAWASNVPTDLDGQYFVGVSNPLPSEKLAREDAMRDARDQVVKYLGEWLTESSTSTETKSLLSAALDETTTKQAISQGLARMVKDRKWCGPSTSTTVNGPMQAMKVLAFFPNGERTAASRIALESLIASKKAKGEKTDAIEAALAALK
jgi:hypothetical protein